MYLDLLYPCIMYSDLLYPCIMYSVCKTNVIDRNYLKQSAVAHWFGHDCVQVETNMKQINGQQVRTQHVQWFMSLQVFGDNIHLTKVRRNELSPRNVRIPRTPLGNLVVRWKKVVIVLHLKKVVQLVRRGMGHPVTI